MKTLTHSSKWLLATAALALAIFGAWRVLRPAEVPVVSVTEQRAERILAITGRTRPKVTVTVLPKVGGQVLSLTKEEGDVVALGDEVDLSVAEPETVAEDRPAALLEVSGGERLAETAEVVRGGGAMIARGGHGTKLGAEVGPGPWWGGTLDDAW